MADKPQTIDKPGDNTGNTDEKKDYSLKGSFISVLILGAFIVLSWGGVYAIFITR